MSNGWLVVPNRAEIILPFVDADGEFGLREGPLVLKAFSGLVFEAVGIGSFWRCWLKIRMNAEHMSRLWIHDLGFLPLPRIILIPVLRIRTPFIDGYRFKLGDGFDQGRRAPGRRSPATLVGFRPEQRFVCRL